MTHSLQKNLPPEPADGFAEYINICIVRLAFAWFQVRMELPHKCVIMNTDHDTAPASLYDLRRVADHIARNYGTITIELDNESEDTARLTLDSRTDATTRLTVTDWCEPEQPPRLDMVIPSQKLAAELQKATWKFQVAEISKRQAWHKKNSDSIALEEDIYLQDICTQIIIRPYSEIIDHYASDEDGCIFNVADTFEDHPKIETIRKAEERLYLLARWLDDELLQYDTNFPWREFNLLGLEAACILADCLRDIPIPVYFVWQEDKYSPDNDRKILLTEDFCRSEELQRDIMEIHQSPHSPGPCL